MLLAQATLVHVAATPVRRARHGEPAPAVVSLAGEAEEGLVGPDDAVHPHGIHHGLQRVEDPVPPQKRCGPADAACHRRVPHGPALHHAAEE